MLTVKGEDPKSKKESVIEIKLQSALGDDLMRFMRDEISDELRMSKE